MLLVWISFLLIWITALAGWIFFSPFVHELFHLATAFICGFRIKAYRLVSIPGGAKGYVDVVIAKGTEHYYLKRGMLHLSGIMAHLSLAVICFLLFRLSREVLLYGVWLEGLMVNAYLVIMNVFPEDSDGRQFWDMVKQNKL